MPDAPAKICVRDSIEVPAESEVRVVGELGSGSVRAGMQVCISFGSFSVVVPIKRVEFSGGASSDEISIALDTPDQETRKLWKELCQPSHFIGVIEETEKESMK